jgi:DNA-directed RNA polymerase subunit H (RpoH/RPB5)
MCLGIEHNLVEREEVIRAEEEVEVLQRFGLSKVSQSRRKEKNG